MAYKWLQTNKNNNIHKNEVQNIGFGIGKSKKKKNYSNRSLKKEIGILWSRQSFGESTISDFESQSNFQVKEKKIFKSVQKQRNWTVVVRTVFWGKYNIEF